MWDFSKKTIKCMITFCNPNLMNYTETKKIIDELKNKATASAIAIDDLTTRLIRLEQLILNP